MSKEAPHKSLAWQTQKKNVSIFLRNVSRFPAVRASKLAQVFDLICPSPNLFLEEQCLRPGESLLQVGNVWRNSFSLFADWPGEEINRNCKYLDWIFLRCIVLGEGMSGKNSNYVLINI